MSIVAKTVGKTVGLGVVCGLLIGCDQGAGGYDIDRVLPKGEQISARALLAEHKGRTICTEYEAATQTCASIINVVVSGNSIVGTETAVLEGIDGAPTRLDMVSRGKIEGDAVCVDAGGYSVGAGSDDAEFAEFVVEVVRDFAEDLDGICATYFKAGDGYVVTAKGRNGETFPPGDTPIRFVDGTPNLRVVSQ